MIIAAIIIGIILITFCFLTFYISDNEVGDFDSGVTLGIIFTILLVIEGILISCIIDDPYPTAIDVYQGKTTLQYVVVDSVVVDSCVIWKNKEEEL